MEFGFSSEERAFRKEVISFVEAELRPEVVGELATGNGPGPATKEFNRKLGAKGWLTVNWPKKYGGLGGTFVQRLILIDELTYRRAWLPWHGACIAGPTILHYGSDDIKDQYLPRIASGEIDFAVGYTEPDAGSDLASMDMRAIEDGDDYVINGQKMFNTACHYADYHWMGARTDPSAPKHKGISLFIVDLASPGIDIRPIETLSMRTNVVYYQDVRVPKRNLVGEKNRGFYYIATALDFERSFSMNEFRRDFDELVDCVKELSRRGVLSASDPLIRQRLAEVAIEVEAAWLLSYRVAWMLDQNRIPNYESAMLKLYVTEARQHLGLIAQQTLGPLGQLRKGSRWTPMSGRPVEVYLGGFVDTVVAGTNEIQRNIIAMRGLGLPRA